LSGILFRQRTKGGKYIALEIIEIIIDGNGWDFQEVWGKIFNKFLLIGNIGKKNKFSGKTLNLARNF
jgi:hypothetical protein